LCRSNKPEGGNVVIPGGPPLRASLCQSAQHSCSWRRWIVLYQKGVRPLERLLQYISELFSALVRVDVL
jgi:hypothetical protein